jgi:hypothetical protein
MVGVSGFEPPTSWSQTMRASRCATPRGIKNYNAEKTSDAISLLAVRGLRIAIWRGCRVLENICGLEFSCKIVINGKTIENHKIGFGGNLACGT